MKKIIVITRENNDAFRHHDIISKHIAQNNSIYSPDKLFAHLFNCALNISTEEPEGIGWFCACHRRQQGPDRE